MAPWAPPPLHHPPGTNASNHPPPPPPPPGFYSYQQNVPAYTPVQVRQSFDQASIGSQYYSQPPASAPPLQPMHAPLFALALSPTAAQAPVPAPVRVPVQVPAPAPAPAPPVQRKKIDWPQPVRHYVQRSFDPSNIIPDVSKTDMESKLKSTISSATDNGALHTIDWDNLPLPQQMIRDERAKASLSWPSPAPFQPALTAYSTVASVPRKRKSVEVSEKEEDNLSPPPWRVTNNRSLLEDRVSFQQPLGVDRGDNRHLLDESLAKATSKSQKNLEKRQRRFDGGYKSSYKRSPTPDASTGPVVGTCQDLEKRYLRLTSAPNPATVRPLDVLKRTLEVLKKKWKKESNYSYICDQFKSMRQDLTVQHIKNDFTVTVYEIHARIALEKGDLGEYNQCQTQLHSLYAQKVGGHPVEFKAYRILYLIHTSNRTALNDTLADLTTAEKEERPIKHALSVRSALALGNYHKFFRLYLDTPNMGAYLMDMFVERERLAAMSNICKAYKPDVKLRFITEELGFESDSDAAQFIIDHKGQDLLEEREDGIRLLSGKAGAIFENAKVLAFRKVDIKGQI